MEAVVVRHLRVEGGAEQVSLLDGDDPAVRDRGEHRHALPDRFDRGRPDEHRVHRGLTELGDVEVGLEGVELVAEGVAPHGDVEAAEGLLPRRSRRAPCRRA